MPESNPLVFWGIDTQDLPRNPPQTVNERISRAVRLGALVNACDWNWRQSWLTGWQEGIDAGDATLRAIGALMPQDDLKSKWRFRLIWAWKTLRFFCRDRSSGDGCQFRESWEKCIPSRDTNNHAKLSRKLHNVLDNLKEQWIRRYHIPFDGIPRVCKEVLSEREQTAFRLGEVLDQGIRPPNVHHHVYVLDENPPFLIDPSSAFVVPGEIAPEGEWEILLPGLWKRVFGASAEFGSCQRDMPNYLCDANGRRELVSRLIHLATSPSQFAIATTPTMTSQTLADPNPDMVSDLRSGPVQSSGGFNDTHHSGPMPAKVTLLTLTFIDEGKKLTILNERSEEADFTGERKAFEFVRFLASQPDPNNPRQSRLCTKDEVFEAVWPRPQPLTAEEKADGQKQKSRPNRNQVVPTHGTIASDRLNKIGWVIDKVRFKGYALRK